MSLDPTKISEEVGATWRSSPLIVGMQLVTLVMMGSLLWDRHEQRQQMTPIVTQMLEQLHAQAQLLARCAPDRSEDTRRNVPSSLYRDYEPPEGRQ